ncbi:MAG: acyl carrier protein [Dorea sp.]|nr:acyl carrier protein [Dorea sp.]MCI9454846.1 acyl carrier protein [Dorea sp.]
MDKLLEILNRIKPEVNFMVCQNLVDEGILDSIDIVSIISEIETEYSIEIDPDEIDPDNFQSAKAIQEMLEKAIG